VVLTQSDVLEVRRAPGKGRGVFARVDIPEGTIVERVPLLIVDADELEDSGLMDYVFIWSKKTVAIALGYGSIYNHSFVPNARYYDGPGRTKVFMALRDIQAGEEITVNYNGDPKDRERVEFDVVENNRPLVNGHAANGKPRNSRSTIGRPPHRSNGRAVNGSASRLAAGRKTTTVKSAARSINGKRRIR